MHLARALGELARRQQPADERVDRQRQQQVQQRSPAAAPRRDDAGRRRVAEHEAEDERADRVEHRDDGDREQRRVRAVAPGRLAVAADPVAGERQQQRGDAERPEVRGVDEQAAEEAGGRAEDRPAQERDRDERHEQQVGRAADDLDRVQDRDLDDRGDEDDERALSASSALTARPFGTSTSDGVERVEVDERLDLDRL